MTFLGASRSVEDFLCNLSSSMQEFKANDGFHRLVGTGKLSLLTLIGDFKQTKDTLFERRTFCVGNTRRCLLEVSELFDGISQTAEKLVVKVAKLVEALNRFHEFCDMELERQEEAQQSNVDTKFAEMRKVNLQMRKALDDFQSSRITCSGLTSAALEQLTESESAASRLVNKAQVEFDLLRRKVQGKEANALQHQSPGSQTHVAPTSFSEFNLSCESAQLQRAGDGYIAALREAMSNTSFALEQTLMTTWAAANVFLLQLTSFFDEFRNGTKKVADTLLVVKNSQTVSKKLSFEKQIQMKNQSPLRAATAVGNPRILSSSHLDHLLISNTVPYNPTSIPESTQKIDIDELFR